MKKFMKTATLIMLAALACTVDAVAESVVSPDGGLSMTMLPLADRGAPSFTISYNGAVALPVVRVGLVTDRSNYADSMRLKSVSAAKVVTLQWYFYGFFSGFYLINLLYPDLH